MALRSPTFSDDGSLLDSPDSPYSFRSPYSLPGVLRRFSTWSSSANQTGPIIPLAAVTRVPTISSRARGPRRILSQELVAEPTSQYDSSDQSLPSPSPQQRRRRSLRILIPPRPRSRRHSTTVSSAPTLVNDDGNGPAPFATAISAPATNEDLHSRLKPCMPEELSRYDRKGSTNIGKEKPKFIVPAMKIVYKTTESLPPGWERHSNPEGKVFFYHRQDNVITESWMYDKSLWKDIESFAQYLRDRRAKSPLPNPSETQIVLELLEEKDNDGRLCCMYYLAHHGERVLFWFHEFDIEWHLSETRGIPDEEHIKIYIEAAYWKHFEFFSRVQDPAKFELVRKELSGILIEAHADTLTSMDSTCSMSQVKLETMAVLLNRAKKDENDRWIIGRFMYLILMDRYKNFYNHRGARLSRYDSVHGEMPGEKQASKEFQVLSPLLFSSPDVHLRDLNKMWVDKLLARGPWERHVDKCRTEWVETTFFSGLLLTTNVSFLDLELTVHPVIRLLSYCSIICSFGSMILALLLTRNYRTRDWTVEEGYRFLEQRHGDKRGFEFLAVMYSLPYALLMWGVIFLLSSFLFMCSNGTDMMTRLGVFVMTGLVTGLILWCVWSYWEEGSWTKLGKTSAKVLFVKPTAWFRSSVSNLRTRFKQLVGIENSQDKTANNV